MKKSNVRTWLKYGLMAILSSFIFCMNFDNMSSQNYCYAFIDGQFESNFTHISWMQMDMLNMSLAPYGFGHPEALELTHFEYE